MKSIISIIFLFYSIYLNAQIKQGIYNMPNDSGFGANYIDVYSDSMLYYYSGGCLNSNVSFYKYKVDNLGKMRLTNLKEIDYSFITKIYFKVLDSIDINEDYNNLSYFIKNCKGENLGEGFNFQILDNDKIVCETEYFNRINFLAFDSLNLKLGISTINRFQKVPFYFTPKMINGVGNFLIIETTLPERLKFFIHDLQLGTPFYDKNTVIKYLNNVIYVGNAKYYLQKN